MSDHLLEGALGLAAQGIPVISLRSRSKVPRHVNWPKLGMLDPETIRLEWELNPGSNVGALCGREAFRGQGLTIVDVDLPDGPDTLERLEGRLPVTSVVSTPSGGAHYYLLGYTASWNPGPGVEVRSIGRQCAAPPSLHPKGGQYQWLMDEGCPLSRLPDWLLKPTREEAVVRRASALSRLSGLRDPVLEIGPAEYFHELCWLVPDRDGFVCCPLPTHQELEPSCKVYPTAEQGWSCYGESCRQGGDIVSLAALLAGLDTPVTGYRFIQTLDYLRGRFA